MDVLVIHEKDLQTKEDGIIGVADSVVAAEKIILEYYGETKEISKQDIRDSSLEYSKVLQVNDFSNRSYQVKITLEWFTLNS